MLSFYLVLLAFSHAAICSDISIFKDRQCASPLRNRNGPNGYPEGSCTPLNLQTNNSFQIVGLDLDCSVTLYGPDKGSDPCSSDLKIIGTIAQCYNTTWKYYSIDGCAPPVSDTRPSSTSTSISSSTSVSSTFSTSSTATTTLPPAAPASPSPTGSSDSKTGHTGLIVGASLGGVGVIALIAIASILFLRRRRRYEPPPDPPSYELSNDRGLLEAGRHSPQEKVVQTELFAHDSIPLQEIGRNSVHMPPVELAADGIEGSDKKGFNPIMNIHMER